MTEKSAPLLLCIKRGNLRWCGSSDRGESLTSSCGGMLVMSNWGADWRGYVCMMCSLGASNDPAQRGGECGSACCHDDPDRDRRNKMPEMDE